MRSSIVSVMALLALPAMLAAQQATDTKLPGGQQPAASHGMDPYNVPGKIQSAGGDVQPSVAANDPAAASTGGTNNVLTVTGKLDTKILAKPTLTTQDNKIYRLHGPLAETVTQLEDIDDQNITVSGTLGTGVAEGDEPALTVVGFEIAGQQGMIGSPAMGTPTGDLAPVQKLQGTLDTKLIGKPDITTADNRKLRLIGPQVKTLTALDGLDGQKVEVAGQLIGQGDNQLLVLHGFRVLDINSKLGQIGMIGLPAPGGADMAMAPTVTLQGTVDTKLLGKPELHSSDGKEYELIGPQVSVLEEVRDIQNQRVELSGQIVDDGDELHFAVNSFRVIGTEERVGQAAETAPTSGAPPPYGKTSINPSVGAPPEQRKY